jgi:A nuclease of the HNH/ENDO VII superfamily with conserved WHH
MAHPWEVPSSRVQLARVVGDSTDFGPADAEFAKRMGWMKADGTPNAAEARRFRSGRYTWHHIEDCSTLILVPMELHRATSHLGGASLARGGVCR